jgi:hypothetical protein
LYQWLARQSPETERIQLSFKKIESIVGFRLPALSRFDPQWWGNETGAARDMPCRAWMDAGFEVSRVDLLGQTVEFVWLSAANETHVSGDT